MNRNAEIKSISFAVPRTVRTNEYYIRKYPHIVEGHEQKMLARMFSVSAEESDSKSLFVQEMMPYAGDPFRGTQERRILSPDKAAIDLEVPTARKALSLAGMKIEDIDLILVASFLPDQFGAGNAVSIANELHTNIPAWNVESTCAGSIVALQMASALVMAGLYNNILITVSGTYSRISDEEDTLSWFLGDGAASFIVGVSERQRGFLGGASLTIQEMRGAFDIQFRQGMDHRARLTLIGSEDAGRCIVETSEPYLRKCCDRAFSRTGLKAEDIDFYIFNTASAWFSSFAAKAIGIGMEKTISVYHRYGNIAVALMPANLQEALCQKKIKDGDLVMLYGFGAVGTATSAILRMGEIAFGETIEI